MASVVGHWELGEKLGKGANGTVYRGIHLKTGAEAAVKVINTYKVDKEPYQRFVREIEFLRAQEGLTGILPLMDSHLPEDPSKDDPPWLAMPVAVAISKALEDKPLEDVVAAVTAIAQTLARLQTDSNVAHRDVKPNNLYWLNGLWLIGDFGLVTVPDAAQLTQEGRQVGPAHYTAYEMILDASSADPHPADVYSLGKTLWVLATGQRWPPEGHQPAGSRGFGVEDFRPHPRAAVLDQEIDLMTRLRHEERPSKEQVAQDLASWAELPEAPIVFDVSKARAQLHRKIWNELASQDMQEQRKECAIVAARQLQEMTAPLNAALKSLYERAIIDMQSDQLTQNLLKSGGYWGHTVAWRWQRCSILAPHDGPMTTTLRMGRCLELLEDGTLRLHAMVNVGPEGVMGTYYNSTLEVRDAPAGSIEAEKMLRLGVDDLTTALASGIDVFIEHVPDPT